MTSDIRSCSMFQIALEAISMAQYVPGASKSLCLQFLEQCT